MGEVVLIKHQAGLESTRGTQVAATRKVYGTGMWDETVPPIWTEDEDRQSFDAHFRSQPGLIQSGMQLDAAATYEDVPWWCQLALKGGVTGVLSNTSVYTYTFVPTQATDDLKTATIETGDDTQAWKAGFVMVDELELSAALGEAIKLRVKLIADDFATATFTGALSDRVLEDAVTHLSKVAIGNAGAVPSSYLTGRLIGWTFKVQNMLKPKFFADGGGAKYTGMGRARRKFTLDLAFEGNAATITERANYDSKTPRVVRVTAIGSNIAASSPTTPKSIDIVLAGIWTKYQVGKRDTNVIFNATLEGQYDSALAYALSLAVANALSALP